MRVATIILLGLIGGPLAVLLILWGSGCAIVSVDKGTAVAQNEAVLKTLHQYPGAKLVNSYSLGVPKPGGLNENGPPYKGFNTYHTYELAHPVPGAKLMAYFHHVVFRHWKWNGPGPYLGQQPCEANFTSPEGAPVHVVAYGCHGTTSSYTMEIDQG